MLVVEAKAEFVLTQTTAFPSHLQNGSTPIFVASQNGHIQVVEILLDNGANPNIQTEVKLSNPLSYSKCILDASC